MRERGNGKRQDSIDQGIRSVSLEGIFCFPKWKFENYSERSIVTCDSKSDRTYNALGHNRMTRNEFGDDIRFCTKIDALRKKSQI